MFNPVAPYRYLLPNLYLSVAERERVPNTVPCGTPETTSIRLDFNYDTLFPV